MTGNVLEITDKCTYANQTIIWVKWIGIINFSTDRRYASRKIQEGGFFVPKIKLDKEHGQESKEMNVTISLWLF